MAHLQRAQQIDDLRLHGAVERRSGFVEDQEFGSQGQGPGNADALPLATGKLVGIAGHVLGFKPNLPERLSHPRRPLRGRHARLMHPQALLDDALHREARRQAAERILKDDLQVAAFGHQGTAFALVQGPATELDGALGPNQAQQPKAKRRFAGPRLPHHP